MELGLFQQQTMKLVMTQELRQAISILQYSRQELAEFLHEQALENPLIELQEPSFEDIGRERASYRTSTYKANEDYNPFDFIKDDKEDLKEDLLQQARCLKLDDATYKRLEYMILLLDDDGYLPETITTEIAEELRISEKESERVLSLLQNLDPAGVGARDLKECLLLQINRYNPDNHLAKNIVRHHLYQLAEKKWETLAVELNVSIKDVQDTAAWIQTLQPKPGSLYNTEKTRFMTPDLTIEKTEDGYAVILQDDFLPTVHLNRQYDGFLSNKVKNEAVQYVQEKYKQMMWLVKSIEQRRRTLIRVTEMIVKKQKRFLEKGLRYLEPMTLKEVAAELDVHESTVSRAVRNKNVQTPVGLYELKSFFTSKVNTASGTGASSASVKVLIKEMISGEDKDHPLSDQKIAETLKMDHGIAVSRRTVAKYREQLNIASSAKRKKYRV